MTTNQIYQPLVTYDVKNPTDIQGVLAKSWSVAADGTTFTFKMNEQAKFASGNDVTAKDAEYSLHRLVKMGSRTAFIITQFGFTKENVADRIKAIDSETLVIKIAEPYAPSFLLYCLSSFAAGIIDSKLVMEHVVDNDYGNKWLKSKNSAGSGPFILKKWKPKKSISLVRNDNYWGEKPPMERIILRHVSESASQRLLLEKGDIDIANKLGPDDHEAMTTNDDIQ